MKKTFKHYDENGRFEIPSKHDRLKAIGYNELLKEYKRDPKKSENKQNLSWYSHSESFKLVANPNKGDWLYAHKEKGQTFRELR